LGSKDIEIRKVEFVTKTQFLSKTIKQRKKQPLVVTKKRGGHTTGHKKEKEMAKLA